MKQIALQKVPQDLHKLLRIQAIDKDMTLQAYCLSILDDAVSKENSKNTARKISSMSEEAE